MPTFHKVLVSPVPFTLMALLLGATSVANAQTAAAAPTPAVSSPAAIAAQQGLSESVLRQAQGPYRMILNQPVTVARPKVPANPARVAEPVAAAATPAATLSTAGPLSAEARKAALDAQNAQASVVPVTARSAAPAAVAAPVKEPPAAPALSTVAPVQVATPVINPAPAQAAAPPASLPPAAAVAVAVAVAGERPLVAILQEEPLLTGPLARERPTGVVQVGFNVNPNGSTSDVSIVSSSNRKLNSAVVNAVTKWMYQPLQAVRRVEVAIEFKND